MTLSEKDRLELFLRDDSEQAVIKRAHAFRAKPRGDGNPDPLPDIPPSLLSADDIARYFEKAGVIYPFDFRKRITAEKPEGIHRLKAATYEGRIGHVAYIFDPAKNYPKPIPLKGKEFLTFPANSIVFVESDLYFRLPPFIAVRFNLQIRHVHRGLLLGTGPLVDPGFWGKLCIPIHNLTDQDYKVPLDEGLIWIEFTKTTSQPLLGEEPSNSNLDDIKGAIDKASQPYVAETESIQRSFFRVRRKKPKRVGIRSSIGSVFRESQETAKSAENAAKSSRNWARGVSFLGIATLVFGSLVMYQLWCTYREAIITYEDSIRALSTETTNEVSSFAAELEKSRSVVETLQRKVDAQASTIERLNRQLDALPSK